MLPVVSIRANCLGSLPDIEFREDLAQVLDFRSVIENDVRLVRVQGCVILVIRLGWIERPQRGYLGGERGGKYFLLSQLRDIVLGYALLLVVGIEDRRAVLRSLVRTLAVQLRGIVRNREKHSQQFTVCNLRRIEDHLNGLGVAGLAGADDFVFGSFGASARVARRRADHSLNVLEYGLHTPEAAAGKNGGFLGGTGGARRIHHWRRDGRGWTRFRVARCGSQKRSQSN